MVPREEASSSLGLRITNGWVGTRGAVRDWGIRARAALHPHAGSILRLLQACVNGNRRHWKPTPRGNGRHQAGVAQARPKECGSSPRPSPPHVPSALSHPRCVPFALLTADRARLTLSATPGRPNPRTLAPACDSSGSILLPRLARGADLRAGPSRGDSTWPSSGHSTFVTDAIRRDTSMPFYERWRMS